MTRIGLLSDTHGYLDPTLQQHFDACDEIWHAGDIGDTSIIDELSTWNKNLRLVYGNIDTTDIRSHTSEELWWQCENVPVFMTHIGGYPDRYPRSIHQQLIFRRPKLFICGHSHILRIIYDRMLDLLHVNPGAAGRQGLHQMRTAVRFEIDGSDISAMEIIELGKRG